MPFVNTSSASGLYLKYRAFLVENITYPGPVMVATHWIVNLEHVPSGSLRQTLEVVQRDFDRDPASVVGEQAWAGVQAALKATGLDYCGVDFGVDHRGVPVLFEVNPAMRLSLDRASALPWPQAAYLNAACAFNRMLSRRVGGPEVDMVPSGAPKGAKCT